MEGNWKIFASGAATVILSLAIGVSAGSALAAPAEPKLTVAPPLVSISVDPPLAAPGVPRRIVVSGIWPNGCIPTQAQLGQPPSWARDQAIGILLAEPLTLQACTSAFRPYRFELDYTPTTAGQREIVVMTTLASPLGSGTIVTGSAAEPRARYDASGAWYDPDRNGSGVMITHDFGKSDRVFATFQLYDSNGAPRWYSLQEGAWSADGMTWEGSLYESRGFQAECPVCPSVFMSSITRAGVVRLLFSVNGANGGLDAQMRIQTLASPPQVVLSNLQRFLPTPIVLF